MNIRYVLFVLDESLLDIPFFKQVILMATTCDHCGQKTSEVKPGGT